ncbi:MAG TPA: 3-phosphoshikimate 1-carboxyvinyltransferase [Candidatus Diapherotrites archaeon]|uniref:3-phosphoshikimate 1-carboxyvinyltransferase n=1 Tax=Candidatus Iainarchaeum sp. TaxID=3101447 RepID=A0A7J4IXB5_9ARCH|nr:3-phosphoshikimate 1-carboxyvinyltransferase [Candidatus Diapherotrites archaeon]
MKQIKPVQGIDAIFTAPPSKAYTLRCLFIAALASGKSVLKNALAADDQLIAAKALSQFGAKAQFNGRDFIVEGSGGELSAPVDAVFTANSGVTTRFLLPLAGLARGNSTIDGDMRMRQRPIKELVDSLSELGAEIKTPQGSSLPVQVFGKTLLGGKTRVSGSESSQFLSALLVCAPYMEKGLEVKVEGLRSKPYIDITIDCMNEFGVRVENRKYGEFIVRNGRYGGREFEIEGDYSSASYFFAAAAILGGKVLVRNLRPDSVQGDRHFLAILEKMGCSVQRGKDFVQAERQGRLNSIDVDMGDFPDLVPTLAVVCAFAGGKSKITNISHLAAKESNRIESVAKNLQKCGVEVEYGADYLQILGGNPRGARIITYNDHRIAMAFSVMGLAAAGMMIDDEKAVAKSYPDFFNELSKSCRKKNIAFIGYRGSGKSTAGKLVCQKLGMEFVDLDAEIMKMDGRPIPRIFAQSGEAFFRELEKKAVARFADQEGLCIACGGGVVEDVANIDSLKRNSIVVLLDAKPKTLYSRIKGDPNRPELTDKKGIEEVEHMLAKRKKAYESAADFVVSGEGSIGECAALVLEALGGGRAK